MPVAHWYSSGWKRWCSLRSISVIANGPRRSARTANRPAKPPPMTTTRCGRAWMSIGSAFRVEPGIAVGQQRVGLLRTPAVLRVRVRGNDVAEDRVDDPPGCRRGQEYARRFP